MVQTTILANARLVLQAETLTGHVVLTDGIITGIGQEVANVAETRGLWVAGQRVA